MRKEILSIALLWLLVVNGALLWNISEEHIANRRLAFETARSLFQQILDTRRWNARHGGVYAPITKDLKPNPYLDDPLRDLKTDKGLNLTKINPAYMTRQIAEIAAESAQGVQFHITSLKPIRPQNAASSWERTWLESFEAGQQEAGDFFDDGRRRGFRYMAPLLTEDSCLRCHARQGYKKGDIRGGISVTLPGFAKKDHTPLLVGYGLAGLLGLILIIFGGRLLEQKRQLILEVNEGLQKEVAKHRETIDQLQRANREVRQLSGIIPICMHCKEIRDDKGYWNQLEKYLTEHSEAQLSHSICDKCLKEHYPDM